MGARKALKATARVGDPQHDKKLARTAAAGHPEFRAAWLINGIQAFPNPAPSAWARFRGAFSSLPAPPHGRSSIGLP
jgi:hypothetical protein